MEAILIQIGELLGSLGPLIVLPVVITILGLILGMKFTQALRSGLTLAIAFVGIFLTVGLLGENMAAIGNAFAERTGTGLDVIDIGWPAASALAFGTPVGNAIIPIGIVLNVLLIFLGLTKTLDVDMWNFWHQAFIGAVVTFVTGSFALGLFAAAVTVVMAIFLADWSQPLIEKYFKLPGISFPHLQSVGYMLLAAPFAWLLNRVPFLKNLKLDPDTIRKRLGILGEPIFLGLFIGVILAALARQSLVDIILTGINVGAVMLLIPRMVGILMEGLSPVADAARKFMQKKAKGREIYIGLDSAVLIGSPAVIASGLLMIPVEIGLALLLAPLGNRTLPFIDLADGVFVTAMIAPLVAGDVLLTVILGGIVMGVGLIGASLLAPAVTDMVASAGSIDIPAGYTNYTVMSDGAIPHSYIFYFFFRSPVFIAIALSLVFLVVHYFLAKKPLTEAFLGVKEEEPKKKK
ncbi:MAG TPA: PTS transporter subunit IIC [Pelolinea sp.]|nr:PTS transporter subunit IIC [Pelolinea sp.]